MLALSDRVRAAQSSSTSTRLPSISAPNVALLKNMAGRGYGDARTILRRVAKMEQWLANPALMSADPDAEYADTIEVDLDQITQPIVRGTK